MFADWTRGELLQLGGIVVAFLASMIGIIVTRMVRHVYTLVNGRLTEMIDAVRKAARAEGREEARAELKDKGAG